MAVSIPSKEEIHSDNIRIGFAELIAVHHRGKLHWAIPGGGYIRSKVHATDYARRLNTLITVNMKRFNRDLLWS